MGVSKTDGVIPTTSDSVIILAADEHYMPHAKAVMAGCRLQGKWQGDFVVIVPQGTRCDELSQRGVIVLESNSPNPFYQKFAVWSRFFLQWKRAFYMDVDVLVQDEIAPLLDELHQNSLIADREIYSLFHCFTYWATHATYNSAPDGIYDWLWGNYHPNYRQFNTAFLLLRPDVFMDDVVSQLSQMKDKIHPINIHVVKGTDQPVINLCFYEKFTPVRDKLLSYWDCATEATRVVHYCSGYAPWIDKTDDMAACFNDTLGARCHEIYKYNLTEFDNLFPVQPTPMPMAHTEGA
jgi:hypothetical protein